jgi:hypothetical protein
MATIPIDKLVEELSSCLNEVNDKLGERYLAYQKQLENEYGDRLKVDALLAGRLLGITRACVKINGKPLVKNEKLNGASIPRVHLALGNFEQSKGISLEIVLDKFNKHEGGCGS